MPVNTKKKRAPKKTVTKNAVKRVPKKAARQKTNQKIVSPDEISNRIQQKAYEIFERRGCSHGYNDFDWNVAENLVSLEVQRDKLKTKKRINFDEQELNQKIEQKAYELFAKKGCRHGDNELDWYLAESLVRLESL